MSFKKPGLFMVRRLKDAQVGVTLVELVLSIVIISISLVGIFSVINMTTGHSGDPIVTHQALAIAESYMDEILLQDYSGTAAASRANYNNVDNYNGLVDNGARDQAGNAIVGLSQYTVRVTVNPPAVIVGGVSAKKIVVTVSGPGISGLSLTGYRASY